MSFALKHNLTDAALQDLLQLVSYFIPKPNIWVSSLYTFKKIFNTTQLKSTCIYYSKYCKSTIDDILQLKCHLCGTEQDSKSYFVSIRIKDQIKNLFNRPGFFHAIQHRFTRMVSPGIVADVKDGVLYGTLAKAGKFLSSIYNLSFQFNTDGVPLFSSSSFSVWPNQWASGEDEKLYKQQTSCRSMVLLY